LPRPWVSTLSRFTPLGVILNRLKPMVRSMLSGVLRTAISKLPKEVQPVARIVAGKLGIVEGESEFPATGSDGRETGAPAMLAEAFDAQLVGLLGADVGAGEDGEGQGEGANDEEVDAHRDLDIARAKLAEQLVELAPGESAAPAIQQFLPAVMAARPLIKMALSLIGRDRVIGFVSGRIASLIQGLVGRQPARQLARPLVDLGFKALGLEAPANPEMLSGEALAATVEHTMESLLDLPAEAFADELQLDAAVQAAFAEAAAGAVPDRFLKHDLPEREVAAGGNGVWIMMPRAARPHYRYRRYSRVFAVPVTRQAARAVPWSDGGTLESYLLDRGVSSWPALAEIRVYETMAGAELGHLAQGESGSGAAAEQAQEFQPLTPEVAGLLIGEPGLGRRSGAGRGHRPHPGRRYVHVRPMGRPGGLRPAVRRPRRRIALTFALAGGSPYVRVALRLSERRGQELAAALTPGAGKPADVAAALAVLETRFTSPLTARIVHRLRRGGLTPDVSTATLVAGKVVAGVNAALSGLLKERPHLIMASLQDPADGITITVTFAGVTKESLNGSLPVGTVAVHPGWRHR
jgi:hypothetical protein